VPLYRALGFAEVEPFDLVLSAGVLVPVVRMRRPVLGSGPRAADPGVAIACSEKQP
jgi:hypothetical protein